MNNRSRQFIRRGESRRVIVSQAGIAKMFFRAYVMVDLDPPYMPICSMRFVERWFRGNVLCMGLTGG